MHIFYYTDVAFPKQKFEKAFPGETREEAQKLFDAFLDRLIEVGKIVYEC